VYGDDLTLRNHILMSLIDSESLEPSGLDVLGSVAEDILNERESQAPSSCMS
jgi:hypothetical protein